MENKERIVSYIINFLLGSLFFVGLCFLNNYLYKNYLHFEVIKLDYGECYLLSSLAMVFVYIIIWFLSVVLFESKYSVFWGCSICGAFSPIIPYFIVKCCTTANISVYYDPLDLSLQLGTSIGLGSCFIGIFYWIKYLNRKKEKGKAGAFWEIGVKMKKRGSIISYIINFLLGSLLFLALDFFTSYLLGDYIVELSFMKCLLIPSLAMAFVYIIIWFLSVVVFESKDSVFWGCSICGVFVPIFPWFMVVGRIDGFGAIFGSIELFAELIISIGLGSCFIGIFYWIRYLVQKKKANIQTRDEGMEAEEDIRK